MPLRHAIRGFVRRPAFAAALVLSVALGIGGNAVVRGFMNGLVSVPMPLPPAAGEPVTVRAQRGTSGLGLLSARDVSIVAAQTDIFDPVVALLETRNRIRVLDRSLVAAVATVSPAAVDFFGLPRGEGIVLSAAFVRRELNGRHPRADERITIDGTTYAIAGVAPFALDGAYVGRPIDIWIIADPASLSSAATSTLSVLARLREGRSMREAQRALRDTAPDGVDFVVDEYTGLAPDMQAAMSRLRRLMPVVAGAVFLIACANVAVLLLSRASRDARDTAVRLAIGATHRTLARATLIDAAIVALAGTAAGILVAVWTSDIIPALLFEADAEQMTFVAGRAGLITSAAISALIVVACGALPILENRRDTPAAVLSREPRRPSRMLNTLRNVLVVGQMAVCCVLVISAATVSDALEASVRTSAGERLGTPIVATVKSQHNFRRQELGLEYFRTIEKTLLAEPGISSAAWTGSLPGGRATFNALTVEPPALPTRPVAATVRIFTPERLGEVKLPPLSGRMFGGGDTRDGCRVAVVSERAAESFFGGAPLGRLLIDPAGRPFEVIGVVGPKPPNAARPTSLADVYYYEAQEPGPLPEAVVTLQVPSVLPQSVAMLDGRVVSGSYFGAMGFEPLAGRAFGSDPEDSPCRVGVVNEHAADLYFGGKAVGAAVIDGSGRRTTIIGVVREPRLRATQRQVEPTLFIPIEQEFTPLMHVLLGSDSASPDVQARLERRIRSIDGGDPNAIVVMSLEDRLRRSALASERIAALLLSAASLNALLLAVIGLYRITADDVMERQREIAVRSALGAQRWRLLLLVARRAGRLAAAGGAVGVVVAVLFARWVHAVTGFEAAAIDWVWLAGPGVIAIGALLASLLPARRILRLEPLSAMRSD